MKGQAPSPRCGFGLAVWKKTLVVFGGVFDEDGENIAPWRLYACA